MAANNGLHTHFGGREGEGGMGNLAENEQAISENGKTPLASIISVKDEMNPLGNDRQSQFAAGSRLKNNVSRTGAKELFLDVR